MGAGPVNNQIKKRRPSWKLKPPHDVFTQGIVVSGFNKLPSAQALFLFCDWPENGPDAAVTHGKGAWLQALNSIAPVTDADGRDERAATLAFTWTGLQKLGLPAEALATFSAPFCEGMYQEDRLRRLGDRKLRWFGDRVEHEWQGTVIEGGPRWSANIPARKDSGAKDRAGVNAELGEPEDDAERESRTPKTVHALLVLYNKDEDTARDWAKRVENSLANYNVKIVHRLPLDLRLDENGIGREHFGFADGLSQPIPYDEKEGDESAEDTVILSDCTPAKRDPWHGVPLGEILLGHTNGHHEKAPGPIVPDCAKSRAAGLTTDGAPEGFRNLGLDGSYMVVRELQQRVAAFWESLETGAARIRAHDPSATHVTADWLAERVIGRNLDGHLLCPSGFLAADQYNQPQNAFGFLKTDPQGIGCPRGSHVRRANPRDGLAKNLASAQTLLDAANNHRILRRGRKYGTTLSNRDQDDNAERGLLFICLNTDIARQFEFVQQTWLLNKNFATLFDETDPLVGPKGQFTIPEQPLRRIVEVETFIQLAGGDYFFLPSIPALKYLAAL
jgi:Dyp-type peroxidase family